MKINNREMAFNDRENKFYFYNGYKYKFLFRMIQIWCSICMVVESNPERIASNF